MKKNKIKVQHNSVAIIGWHEGTAGQIHSWLEKLGTYHIACFVNPMDTPVIVDPANIQRDVSQFSYPNAESFKDKALINSFNWIETLKAMKINRVLITLENAQQRFQYINQARDAGMELINAIHPTALIMEDAILYENVILHARVYVGYRAEVFSGVIVNTGTQLDHHNVIQECATIDPGVVCAGNVTIARFAKVHTGATIKNRIRIGENSIIGAGTVVIKDVPENKMVVGVPGRIIKDL